MRGFNRLVLASLLGWAVAVVAHAILVSSATLHYNFSDVAGWISSEQRQEEKCRVFIVGSSTVVFGLNAIDIQAATGCTTINTGLMGIGNLVTSHLELVLRHVKIGDIVILSDRNWSDLRIEQSYCAQQSWFACFMTSLRLIPHLSEDINLMFETGFSRSERGDLLRFPPLLDDAAAATDKQLKDFDYRLRIINSQVRRIRAGGAIPILAASPIFVTEAAKQALLIQYSNLSSEVALAVGSGIWIDPLLITNPTSFSLESRHTSAAGRQAWTSQVTAAVQRQL